MSKLSPEMGGFFKKMTKDIGSKPGARMTTNKAVAVLQENQRSEIKVRDFTLVQDEPLSVMGTAMGPTPTDIFVSSVAVCENVVFARNAAMLGIPIDSLETSVEGTWDMKGLFGLEGADSAFRTISVKTKVSTTAREKDVVEAARLTHVRCPIYATLRNAVDLTFKLEINGSDVSL